jgi:putative oxidoreductase
VSPSKKEALFDFSMLVLRIGAGLQLAFFHGLQKLQKFSELAVAWPDPLGLGHKRSLIATIAAEFFCGLLLMLGLAGRVAALAIAFTMGVAAFVVLKAEPWSKRELSLLYLVAALTVLLLGPGRISLDRLIAKRFRRGSGGGRAAPRSEGPVE